MGHCTPSTRYSYLENYKQEVKDWGLQGHVKASLFVTFSLALILYCMLQYVLTGIISFNPPTIHHTKHI